MNPLLVHSMNEKVPVEVIYLSRDQQFSQRKLIIKEIKDEYIRAYCLLRKEMRTFRIDNILSIWPNSQVNKWLH